MLCSGLRRIWVFWFMMRSVGVCERFVGMVNIGSLVLLCYGESDWNVFNLFIGWVDVGLMDKG